MPYARTDENGRLLEWSLEHLDGMDTEFSNGDYVDATATHGLEDFVIRDGVAYFEPTPEKAARIEADERHVSMMAALDAAYSETLIPSDKIGQLWKVSRLGEIELMREYVPDPEWTDDADGSYLKPYRYVQGMSVTAGMWYTDGEDIWEAMKDGIPNGFDDEEYFDIVTV